MAKKLTNTSTSLVFLRRPGIVGVYASSFTLRPGQSATVSDEEYAEMEVNTTLISVVSIADDSLDTPDELATLGLDLDNRLLKDSSDETALNWEARTLRDPADNEAMDWEARELRDPAEALAGDWGDRELHDSSEVVSIDWQDRQGRDMAGNTTLDWQSNRLLESGMDAVHWGNRTLTNENAGIAQCWTEAGQAGATGSRPGPVAVGYMFFDTTLGYTVWWNGAAWVDAVGTLV